LIMRVFDTNSDNKIEEEEFLSTLRAYDLIKSKGKIV